VAASIRGVLAQRLVCKICDKCKEPMPVDTRTAKMLERLTNEESNIESLFHGAGCSKCRNTGSSGRVGLYELFVPDDETLDAISSGATLQELRRLAQAGNGYTELRSDGMEKVKAGLITVEELFTVAATV
ncbi:MAG: type II/IV secretion system protein, partial [Verrucomicrobiota bacterium]|nr:type II/IV secretion system protein [Verrucomicrobiota bacterium]